ncbi:MAG: peptidoglycan DD-metalloendopeptidase family protein [Pontixanthobacter sp.]
MLIIGVMMLCALSGAFALGQRALAQRSDDTAGFADIDTTRDALSRALTQQRAARLRGERLESEARGASQAMEKTATLAAALAARIQQSEAGIAAAEARMALIAKQRARLDRRLAVRREPLVRLTGALQTITRRPLALSALRPGSLRDTVYLRAMLESTVPQVRRRTASLRSEIARGDALEAEAAQALGALRANESNLGKRRLQLAALESRQRLASRRVSGDAARENERALALAEEARDLDTLIGELDEAGGLRKELAALPGPIMRPSDPAVDRMGNRTVDTAATAGASSERRVASEGRRLRFQLPVTGRTFAGFGTVDRVTGIRNDGITLAPRGGAQVVAPARGRVAFAGPYRGYDRIVIIEHEGEWTSLITGMARTDVAVGEDLVAGSPIGIAGVASPRVTLELRRAGTPINPLEYLR